MSEWKVVFTKEAYKAYSKLENAYKKALKRQITKLIERRKSDIKSVEGYENLYRIRIGKYRTILRLHEEKREIFVILIEKRGKVYKKL